MILDFNPARGLYWLAVEAGRAEEIRRDYGFDLSAAASDRNQAVLFTNEPFAAASFAKYATPAAADRLSHIVEQVARSRAEDCTRHFEVPDDRELWPFQRASLDYALAREHALIADEPGLGKTPQAIVVANEMHADRVLVVCPASIRGQWARRIAEWTTMHRRYTPRPADIAIYQITSSKRGAGADALWTIVSWDLIRTPGVWKALADREFDLVVLDEAHYAKTVDARRTRAIFGGGRNPVAAPICERACRILALTGTPLPNRPREAYTLSRHLCWESIDYLSEEAFEARFNPTKLHRTASGKMWQDERIGRMPELQNRLRAHFMTRHLKRDVMPQLHLPMYDLIRVEETAAVKAALAAERLLDIDPDSLENGTIQDLGPIAAARRMMGVAMAPQVADYIAELLVGGEAKLTVFAWHIEVLNILEERLGRFGVVRVDGRDSGKSKERKIASFIDDPHKRVIMGNVLSLGTGTDGLQKVCTHCLLAEADWVHGNNQQCIDRLDRGGQTGQVQADIFVAPGSLSEKVLASALRKGGVVERALDRV